MPSVAKRSRGTRAGTTRNRETLGPPAPRAVADLRFALFCALLSLSATSLANEGLRTATKPGTYKFIGGEQTEVMPAPLRVSTVVGQLSPGSGYVPVQVSVESELAQPARLEVSLTPSDAPRAITAEFDIPPGTRRTFTVPLPAPTRSTRLEVERVDGPGEGRVPLWFYRVSGRTVAVLGGSEPFQQLVGHAADPSSGTDGVASYRAENFPDSLPALIGFDAVVVLDPPLSALSADQQRAIEEYVATGGELVLGPQVDGAMLKLPSTAQRRAGFGEVVHCERAPCPIFEAAARHTPASYPRNIDGLSRLAYDSGSNPYSTPMGEVELLLSQGKPPMGQFLLLLGLFVLLAGPGSIWVARSRGPTWVLLTVPGTAVLASLAIIGWSLISQGLATYGRIGEVTLLDRKAQRAITVEVAALYANLSPRGPSFDASTAPLSPWVGRVASTYAWHGGMRFGGDFLPSRTYREWGLLSIQPSRARLLVRRQGSSVRVQNALGGRIVRGLLRVEGHNYQVAELADGAEAEAAPTDGHQVPAFDTQLEPRFPARTLEVVDARLRDGEFVMKVEGAERIPLGFSLRDPSITELVRGEFE